MENSREKILMRLRHSKDLKRNMIKEADARLAQLQLLMQQKGVNTIYAL